MRTLIALSSLLLLAVAVSADIQLAPSGSIVHCNSPLSYCLETVGDPLRYSVTNTPDAYGACENLHYDHKFAGPCVFTNQNRTDQGIRVECRGGKSYCVATLGKLNSNDGSNTQFQCFGHATAAWTGSSDDTTLKGAEAGVVTANELGDDLKVRCPHAD